MLASEVQQLQNPMVVTNKLSTTTPLNSTLVSHGLGPEDIEDLDLVKEDIGLKEPIIVL